VEAFSIDSTYDGSIQRAGNNSSAFLNAIPAIIYYFETIGLAFQEAFCNFCAYNGSLERAVKKAIVCAICDSF
jgi:hypothetical protein